MVQSLRDELLYVLGEVQEGEMSKERALDELAGIMSKELIEPIKKRIVTPGEVLEMILC